MEEGGNCVTAKSKAQNEKMSSFFGFACVIGTGITLWLGNFVEKLLLVKAREGAALRMPPRSRRDITGFGFDGSEDAVAFAAGGIEVWGF
jgi:hypothetical protein